MYTPLRFINQLENFITVQNVGRDISNLVNDKLRSLVKRECSEDYGFFLSAFSSLWYGSSANIIIKGEGTSDNDIRDLNRMFLENVSVLAKKVRNEIGVDVKPDSDFSEMCIYCMLYNKWVYNKRVYAVDKNLLLSLRDTKLPNDWGYDVLKNLPSNTFYIDYKSKGDVFAEGLVGTFVQSGYDEDLKCSVWFFTHLFDKEDKVGAIHTMLRHNDALGYQGLRDGILNYFKDVECVLDDKNTTKVVFHDRDFMKFFVNFVIYINSQGGDVEYTERTKQIYKPVKKGSVPSNRMREIEEIGVGIKYGASIPKNTIRPKYVVDDKQDDSVHVKRSYSSNWRCGHWHRFHAKDKEGNDTIVIHWIPETFVHGNTGLEDKDVHITAVKEKK